MMEVSSKYVFANADKVFLTCFIVTSKEIWYQILDHKQEFVQIWWGTFFLLTIFIISIYTAYIVVLWIWSLLLPTGNTLEASRSKGMKIFYGIQNVINSELGFFSKTKKRIDTSMNYSRPPLAIGIEPIKKAFLDARGRGVQLRYLTEITKSNLSYCKELMKIVHELHHLDGIKGNFMISEGEYIAPLI